MQGAKIHLCGFINFYNKSLRFTHEHFELLSVQSTMYILFFLQLVQTEFVLNIYHSLANLADDR